MKKIKFLKSTVYDVIVRILLFVIVVIAEVVGTVFETFKKIYLKLNFHSKNKST